MPLTLLPEPVNLVWFLMPRPPASSDIEILESKKIPFFITLSAGALSAIWFGLSLVALSIEWLFDFSGGGGRIQNLDGPRRRFRRKTNEKRPLPTYEPTYRMSQQSSVRKQTKRVSFAHITTIVQSHSEERKYTVSKSAEYDVSSLSVASSTTVVVAPLRTTRPETMGEAMSALDLPMLKGHPIKSTGDVLPSKAVSIGTSKRQPIEDSRMKLGASDSRSSSPVECVARRIKSLRLPSKKSFQSTSLKPKRAHTLPTCAFRKVRRTDPIPRTSPYEAPYFAAPPAPVYEMYGGSRNFEERNYNAHWQTRSFS